MTYTLKSASVVITACSLLLTERIALAQTSDTLTVSRLEADRNGNPRQNTNFKSLTLPQGKEDAPEKDEVTIPRTTYYIFEDKSVGGVKETGSSDTWYFNSFKIRFLSDVLPDKLDDELKKFPLTVSYHETASNGVNEYVPLVNMFVDSPNPKEFSDDTRSDTLRISTFTQDDKGKPYSNEQFLTRKEEETLGLGGTIPAQAIKIYENGKLSDVVLVDPIYFHLDSDTDVLLNPPAAGPDTIRFSQGAPERIDDTAFSLRVTSDATVSPEGSALGMFAIGLIIPGWMLRCKIAVRHTRR